MPAGAPTDYREEFAGQAEKLCLLGATDEEIADFFDVEVRTIYRWKHVHPEFCQAIKSGKDEADERVQRSLYSRAIGFQHDDVDIRTCDSVVVQTPIRKIYPPDTTAAIFWLKNRRRGEWPDKQNVVPQNPDGTALGLLSQISGTPIVPQPPKE